MKVKFEGEQLAKLVKEMENNMLKSMTIPAELMRNAVHTVNTANMASTQQALSVDKIHEAMKNLEKGHIVKKGVHDEIVVIGKLRRTYAILNSHKGLVKNAFGREVEVDIPRRIVCLKCGKSSADEDDIKNLYCPNCHEFHNEYERYQVSKEEIRDALNRLNED